MSARWKRLGLLTVLVLVLVCSRLAAQEGSATPEGAGALRAVTAGAPAGETSLVPDDAFAQAVQAYRAGDYGGALRLFAALAQAEADAGRRAVLHANAGTAAARAQELGQAVWHFEASRRAAPGNPLVARNLPQVLQRLGQGGTEASQFTALLLRAPLALTRPQTEQLLAAALTLALLLLALRRVGAAGRWAASSAVLLLVLGALWLWASEAARAADGRRAVVLRQAPVRSEPDSTGSLLFRLEPGTIVQDAEQRDDWRLIETDGGARGWVPAELVRAAGT